MTDYNAGIREAAQLVQQMQDRKQVVWPKDILALLDSAPAPAGVDDWRDVLVWTDDGEKTLFDWCTGGGDPEGEFARIGLRRETPDGETVYRTYRATGPWGIPTLMSEPAPAGVTVQEWQPIETAPSAHVLFYGNTRHDVGVCFTGWKAQNGRCYADQGDSVKVTHWMPLPAPPSALSGAKP